MFGKCSVLALSILAPMLVGCSFVSQMLGKDDVVHAEADAGKIQIDEKATLQDEQELKVARLWSRVDELEEEVFRQKERVRLLEKGLLTGIAPEALRHPEPEVSLPSKRIEHDRVIEPLVAAEAEPAPPYNPNGLSLPEQEDYNKRLDAANALFRSARYGKAINEFEKLLATYGGKVDPGFLKYWVARSWRQLKEYTTAEEILNEIIAKHASSPWVPRVHYELAKVYIDANNLTAARERLQLIKSKYQYEDVSELATRELEELPKKL